LEGSLGRWFTAGFPERRADVAELVRSMLGAARPEGYAGCCEAIAGMDQRESIRSISVPTAVLAGAEDPSTPPAVGLGIAEAVPGASLTVVAGAAHLATLEQPARVSSWLVDHLVGTPLQRGDAIRRAVLGDANVDRSKGASSRVAASFTDYITRCAWGEVWARPGLDRRVRSCVTLGVLAALGRTEELVLHARGARRNGLTDEEIGEVLLHVAVYAGVPAANSAIATVREALDDA
ncbi:MAG: carboxymuconolactone decarboxylase family protein, partial [Acidimicrobiales bacterium]